MSDARAAKEGPTHARTAAELRKLAHVLGVDTVDLAMLSALPGDDVRTLRRQVAQTLFQLDRAAFARVAAVSKAIPGAVVAKLAEAVLPPLIAARTAELLEPRRAADIVSRVSDHYLADVSAAMDASRAPEVVAAIPPDRVAKVGAELARREEWVVIGGFVSHVTGDALAAAIATFDGGQLLRIGFVLDDLARLDDIGALLSDEQLDEILVAAPDAGLWVELGELVDNLSAPRLERLAARYAAADPAVKDQYRQAATDGDLRGDRLALLA